MYTAYNRVAMVQVAFEFEGKGHTEGALLTTALSAMPEVIFAGYTVDDDNTKLTLCVNALKPKHSLRRAAEAVCADLVALHSAVVTELL